ncbi:hypothetical protein CRE_30516 [Caenorhabditis remanei]|uniref:Uncharacterized protein n=2 Tax=Caenorhabditis remanei TaxID=31234 RepID=E3N663_CAERE|nr:hypothetical protein CRE_03367 [Caenorhabditis remanei]EFP00584.1 hypothetical protein CRE_30516 [Caenorhabditis remanei]
MEETHQTETEKLKSDHKDQVADLQRQIEARDTKIREANEKNERERAEQDRKNLLAQKALKEDYEKKIQNKEQKKSTMSWRNREWQTSTMRVNREREDIDAIL